MIVPGKAVRIVIANRPDDSARAAEGLRRIAEFYLIEAAVPVITSIR